MNFLEKAISIAVNAHSGLTDKGGSPYILHPLRLMLKFSKEDEMIVAVLHDVIEDTEIAITDLINLGFSDRVINALRLLTKNPSETYQQYIENISTNDLARKIKIEDLKDNMDISRLPEISPKDLERLAKYHRAVKTLQKI
jgi:(p)ppGpp synthase/HD superfamily hydrolase